MIDVPYEQLSAEALEGVMKQFILQEGTEYGLREYTLEEKLAQVRRALERGEAKIVYDERDESCLIVPV